MPIPRPRKKEKQKDFISRCMDNEVMKTDYPKQKQRAGVCYTSWKTSKKNEGVIMKLKAILAKLRKEKKDSKAGFKCGGLLIREAFFSLRKELEAAIRVKAGKRSYVQDFSNKEVIYVVYNDGQTVDSDGEDIYYKVPYKIKNKAIELQGEPEKVQREITYEKELSTADLVDLIDIEIQVR